MAVLEWPRLCAHVARFASTTLGRQAVLHMQVWHGLIGVRSEHCQSLVPSPDLAHKGYHMLQPCMSMSPHGAPTL